METPEGHNPSEFDDKTLNFGALTGTISSLHDEILVSILGADAVQLATEKNSVATDALLGLSEEELRAYLAPNLEPIDFERPDPPYEPDQDIAEYNALDTALETAMSRAFGEFNDGFKLSYLEPGVASFVRTDSGEAFQEPNYTQSIRLNAHFNDVEIEKRTTSMPGSTVEPPPIKNPDITEVNARLGAVKEYLEGLKRDFSPEQLRDLLQLDEYTDGFDEED